MKIKKIDNRAEAQAVDDVADRAADDQADRDGEKDRTHPIKPDHQNEHDERGEHREDPKAEGGLTGLVEEPETDAAVAGQHKIEKPGHRNEVVGAARFSEIVEHRHLADLI